MGFAKIQLPSSKELERRLNELIPADEIERERAFYRHGLMWFTSENMGETDEEGFVMFLMMTMGANLSAQTQTEGRPIDIESIIDAIVGSDNEHFAKKVKARFSCLAQQFRRSKQH